MPKGILDQIKDLLNKAQDDLEDEDEEEEYEIEDDPEEAIETVIIRMTLAYNLLVECSETMPTSYAKEFKYKKDKERARILYNRCVELATQYHTFLKRMKAKVT